MSLYDRLIYNAYQRYPDGIAPPPEWTEITAGNVGEVCAEIAKGSGLMAIDTETYGDVAQKEAGRRYAGDALHQIYAKLFCAGFYDGVHLWTAWHTEKFALEAVFDALREHSWTLVFWNAGFDRAILRNSGYPEMLEIDYRDSQILKMLICHHLSTGGEMSLGWFINNILRGRKGSFREEVGLDVVGDQHVDESGRASLLQRVAGDTYYTLKADQLLEETLPQQLLREYEDVERPVGDVIFDMETKGVRLDQCTCQELSDSLLAETVELDRAFNSRAMQHIEVAEPINMASPKQVSRYFYDILELEQPPEGAVDAPYRSTNEEVLSYWLKKYRVPEIALLLDHRKVSKLRSTYIVAPMMDVDDHGRIYPKTNQAGTTTGRFNMERPSLHNLPSREDKRWLEKLLDLLIARRYPDRKREQVALEESYALLDDDLVKILETPSDRYGLRRIYLPDDGCVLIGADYSQVELRLLAHFSEDKVLLNTFREGRDPHSVAGAARLKMDYDEFVELLAYAGDDSDILEKQKQAKLSRSIGKTINFGVVYGMGPQRLAGRLNVSVDEAKQYLAEYFQTHKGVASLQDTVNWYVEHHGEVRTLLLRVRPIAAFQRPFSFRLKKDFSSFREVVQGYGSIQRGRREAFNAIIQGSAADIIKTAMGLLYRDEVFRRHARIVLTVHDEIVASCKTAMSGVVAERMVELMSNPFGEDNQLLVPLKVDCAIGTNLAEVK